MTEPFTQASSRAFSMNQEFLTLLPSTINATTLAFVLIVLAYLLGSLSSAIIVCGVFGLPDPRTEGSGNPGATNVLRIGGKKLAAVTLLGDMLKGLLPIAVAHGLRVGDLTLAAMALAAFFGHLYPVFFKFQGGKGVATSLGALLGLHWPSGLIVIIAWIAIANLSHKSSLAALISSCAAPFAIALLTDSAAFTTATIIMTGFLFWRHRSNIEKLVKGEERRIQW